MEIENDGMGNRNLMHMARDRGFPEIEQRMKRIDSQVARSFQSCDPLLQAASKGTANDVSKLLKQKASPINCKQDGRNALHVAAARSEEEALKCLERLLGTDDADASVCDHEGKTPLFFAAATGLLSCVALLLQQQANPEASDLKGQTSLFSAARAGREDVVKLLIQESATTSKRDVFGRSAIFEALGTGQTSMLALLLHGSSQAIKADAQGRTPLFEVQDTASLRLIVKADATSRRSCRALALRPCMRLPRRVALTLCDAS